jgi:YVTN family beta-propeller protein
MGRARTSVWLLAIVAICALSGVAAASASAAPFAYSADLNAKSTVSVIDTTTHQVVGKPIPVGETADTIAVTPNGEQAYVTARQLGKVTVINTAAHAVTTEIPVGEQPIGVAVSPDGSTVYVSNFGSETVSVISTATNTVIGELDVEGQPAPPAVTPDGRYVWVPRKGAAGGAIEIFSTQTRKPVGTIKAPEETYGLVFTPDGSKALAIVEDPEPEIEVIDTALRQELKRISTGSGQPGSIAISPDGRRAYVSIGNEEALWVIDTATDEKVGSIPVPGSELEKVALTPDGKKALVGQRTGEIFFVNLVTGQTEPQPTALNGSPRQIVVAPDRSPTAVYTPAAAPVGAEALFNGAASFDPDGSIASWNWAFGDGATASGPSVTHAFGVAGTFATKLSVVDNEGCGTEVVFTGQTAYCSGNVGASVTHSTTITQPPVLCSAGRFVVGRVVHNRHNGTARVEVKVPADGSVFLFGKKVHAVTKKSVRAGTVWLTLHARVKVNKRLKQTHRAPIRVRINFFPSTTCGSPANVHRSLVLLRAPKKKHHKR